MTQVRGLKTSLCLFVYLASTVGCTTGQLNNRGFNNANRAAQESPDLLIETPREPIPEGISSSDITVSRFVRVDLSSVQRLSRSTPFGESGASLISFRLAKDLLVKGVVQKFETNAAGSAIWTGTLQDLADGFFTLVERNGQIAAHIVAPQGDFYVLPTNKESLYRVDQIELKSDRPPKCGVKLPDKKRRPMTPSAVKTLLRDDGKRIDILVVYTVEAERYFGTADKLKVVVGLAEKETNLAMQHSVIDLQVRVVNIIKLASFKETLGDADGTSDKDLERLAKGADGKEARDLRDTNRADQVTLLRVQGDLEGIAFLLVSPLDPDYDQTEAFSVLRVDNVVYKYDFTHELGHNLGCHHNEPKTGLYRFSRGYCFDLPDGHTYGTIMSYCGADRRISYYSSPAVKYPNATSGHDTGEPELLPDGKSNPSAADCARTIRDSKLQVANYRQSVP